MTTIEVILRFNAKIGLFVDHSKYYCGITNNLELRAQQHNAIFLDYVEADSVEQANEIEKALQEVGYDCGGLAGNAHEEDSRYVYIYKKGPKTIE